MAGKNVVNWPMFSPSPADLASSQTSQSTSIQFKDNVGILLQWTGTSPIGVVTVEVSDDNFVSSNYTTLDFGQSITISGNSGNHLITMNQLPFTYIRLQYTRTSGTGSLTAALSAKGIGQ